MTREQQIIRAGIEYTVKTKPICIGGDVFSELIDKMNRNRAFEEGAKWADRNPNLREEQVGLDGIGTILQKEQLIDKACKWLLNGGYFVNNVETIDDFKRAMED